MTTHLQHLPQRLQDILERKTELSEEKRVAYLRLCIQNGYDLSNVAGISVAATTVTDEHTGTVHPLVTKSISASHLATKLQTATEGVGTELTRLFAKWMTYVEIDEGTKKPAGTFTVASSCLSCKGLASLLNIWGPDTCEQRIDDDPLNPVMAMRTGIISMIRSNASKHKLKGTGLSISSVPFFDTIMRRLVHKAIATVRRQTRDAGKST